MAMIEAEMKKAWEAAEKKSILVPLASRGTIQITGKDRAKFLQGLFSQDVAKNFPENRMTYGLFTNAKGRVFADAYVNHLNEAFVLDVEAFAKNQLLAYLEKYLILLKAEIKDVSCDYNVISLLGHESAAIFESLFKQIPPKENEVVRLGADSFATFPKNPRFQEYRIYTKDKKELLTQIEETVLEVAPEALYDMLRIESGVSKLGREMNETTFPQEVGLEESLDFKKGCFVGAEVLQRIFYKGHVNRSLALFGLESSIEPIPPNVFIFQEGQEVGKLTASVFSYRWNQAVALGIVKISALDSDLPMSITIENTTHPLAMLQAFQSIKK